MPSDSSTAADLLALWPLALGMGLIACCGLVLTNAVGRTAQVAVVAWGAGLTALAALGLWAWLFSDATRYHDGSSHLDHTTHFNVYVAAGALIAALAVTIAALRRPERRGLLAAALAVSALACLAQTFGFLGYTTPG